METVFIVRYQDDGSKGPGGQDVGTTGARDLLLIFPSYEEGRAWIQEFDRGSHFTRRRPRITAFHEDQIRLMGGRRHDD